MITEARTYGGPGRQTLKHNRVAAYGRLKCRIDGIPEAEICGMPIVWNSERTDAWNEGLPKLWKLVTTEGRNQGLMDG